MGIKVVISLIAMALVAAVTFVLRQTMAKTDTQRHQFSLIVAILFVLSCTTFLDPQHNYVMQFQNSAINLLRQTTMLSLIALGAAVVIIVGGIDLSAGSVIAFSSTVCATFMFLLAPEAVAQSQPLGTGVIVTAITGTLLVGLMIGSLHAWLITEIGLPPFVATLGTLVGLRSLSRAIIESVTQASLGGSSSQIYINDPAVRELSGSYSGTVWNLTILVAVLAVILWLMLSKTVTGRHLYALGGNEQAARLSGIQTNRVKWLAYCISAVLSSMAGILFLSAGSSAAPETDGRGYELNAIAAAVVGGCSLQGGVGTIPGTLLGALFLRVVIDGVAKIIKAGADTYEGLIVGVLVVFAVAFTKTSHSTGTKRQRFAGALGWVTIVNLTILAGVMAALLGAKLLRGHLQMDASWLAGIASLSTLIVLLIVRSELKEDTRRTLGIVWAVATIAVGIGLDIAFPRIQRSAAVAAIQRLGGSVTQTDDGALRVNLDGSRCDDAALRGLAARLRYFPRIDELQLQGTAVTDAGIDAVAKAFSETKSLSQINTTDTEVTPMALTKLKRTLVNVRTIP